MDFTNGAFQNQYFNKAKHVNMLQVLSIL